MVCLINRDCHYTNENHPFMLHQLKHLSTFGTLLVSVVIYVKGRSGNVFSLILHTYIVRELASLIARVLTPGWYLHIFARGEYK
jgi:hypothetical protein